MREQAHPWMDGWMHGPTARAKPHATDCGMDYVNTHAQRDGWLDGGLHQCGCVAYVTAARQLHRMNF